MKNAVNITNIDIPNKQILFENRSIFFDATTEKYYLLAEERKFDLKNYLIEVVVGSSLVGGPCIPDIETECGYIPTPTPEPTPTPTPTPTPSPEPTPEPTPEP